MNHFELRKIAEKLLGRAKEYKALPEEEKKRPLTDESYWHLRTRYAEAAAHILLGVTMDDAVKVRESYQWLAVGSGITDWQHSGYLASRVGDYVAEHSEDFCPCTLCGLEDHVRYNDEDREVD